MSHHVHFVGPECTHGCGFEVARIDADVDHGSLERRVGVRRWPSSHRGALVRPARVVRMGAAKAVIARHPQAVRTSRKHTIELPGGTALSHARVMIIAADCHRSAGILIGEWYRCRSPASRASSCRNPPDCSGQDDIGAHVHWESSADVDEAGVGGGVLVVAIIGFVCSQ